MMERDKFDRQVRDALVALYDNAALETHPLTLMLPKPADQRENRAEHLRRLLLEAIKELRPLERSPTMDSVEWRPYLILHGRYVEGTSLQDLQARLSLSARQLRREHSRALSAVATLLWDRALGERRADAAQESEGSGLAAFAIHREPLDIDEVVRGVVHTLESRIRSENVELILMLPPKLPLVRADRVILRQILLSLINHALNTRSEGATAIGATGDGDGVTLWVQFQGDGQMSSPVEDRDSALEAARYWAGRTGAAFQQTLPAGEQAGICRVALSLPLLSQPVVMVVDDQEPAIRMFGRYLSRSNTRVVGLHEPERVLPIARRLQPHAIILDVMMPTIDGWETLQALKADPETHHIPVIICSVWDEPELAHSLGATEFLKKPITQKDLLSALLRLKVLDSLDGSSPADT